MSKRKRKKRPQWISLVNAMGIDVEIYRQKGVHFDEGPTDDYSFNTRKVSLSYYNRLRNKSTGRGLYGYPSIKLIGETVKIIMEETNR